MKKATKILSGLISVLYKVLPLFIGTYCYYPIFREQDDRIYPFYDAVYSSLMLYLGNFDDSVPATGLLQLARFLALAAALNILINIFSSMSGAVNRIKLRMPGSTVVYGDSAYAENIYENLTGRATIRGGDKFIKGASRYIVMYSGDAANLEFYSRYCEQLRDKNVYIMLEDVSRQNIENYRVAVFSPAESCARQYWKKYPVDGSEKIALIGFGSIGKNLLLYGLQMNIIDPEQHFEYHIYGDGSGFLREHTELDKMAPDKIIFHGDTPDHPAMPEFDRIIVSGNENRCVTVLSKLLEAAPVNCPVYVYAPNGDIVTNLFGAENIVCFGSAEETASPDIVLNDGAMAGAKAQHEYYRAKYGGQPWEKLNAFMRYSNVSSSDFLFTLERLAEKDVSFDTLAELEHIRWCRYYYIHNWKYAPVRNDSKRLHNCLVPFSELSAEERLKDAEAIRSKLSDDDKILQNT